MKIELNEKDMELIIAVLAYAKLEATKTLDEISSLEGKILEAANNQSANEETADCDEEECTKSKETFFYDTFNFEAEQPNYCYEIIKHGEHLRLINGKQGQLGIECGDRGQKSYKPLFISKEDKMLFLKIFQLISNGDTGMKSSGAANELSEIYRDAKPKYSISIIYNQYQGYNIRLITDERKIKYDINISSPAFGCRVLNIQKSDGTSACIECDVQLPILIDFIIYHL